MCVFKLPFMKQFNSFLTNRQAGGGRVSGAALAAGDAAASVSVSAGPGQHPVGPRAHGAQGRTRQDTTGRATPTAGFRETQREREEDKIQRKTKYSQGRTQATCGNSQ